MIILPNQLNKGTTVLPKKSGIILPVSRTGKKADLGTLEGLRTTAEQAGLGEEVSAITNTTPKLSFLQRLGKGLGAFNPAEAVLTGQEKGLGAGLLEYPKRIVQGIGSAVTGKDIGGEQRYFKDVVEKLGIENGVAKFGLGFIGDVLLDPTTYFGGAIAKGIGFTAKGVGGVALKGVEKVAPDVATGLKMAGTGLQDAIGRAFQYGYKASKGATQDVLTFLSKESRAKLGLASSNLDRLGTGVLTQSQREELALKLIAGKRAEFVAREAGETIAPNSWSEAQKTNPELWNTGILRKSQSPFNARGVIPEEVHSAQGKWQNYGQDSEVSADVIYKRIDSGSFKGEYVDSAGNPVRDSKTGNILQDTYDEATGEWVKPTVSNEQLKNNLLEKFSTKEGKIYLSEVVDALPKNPDGTITAYRIGSIGEGAQSYTLSEGMAKTFSNQGTDIPLPGTPGLPKGGYKDFGVLPPNIVKIDPKGIKAWSPYDAEILVEQKYVNKVGTPAQIARETAQSSDPLVQKTINEQIARSQKIGAGVTENPYEVYFPFIKKDKLSKFINESKGIKVGSEGYLKQFKNLLTNENMELDPAKAFFTRESQIVSDKMTRDFLEGFVGKYGKPLTEFKTSDEALKSGYQLVKEKGIFGKELGWVKEFDSKLIRDSISPEFQTINMLAKATGFDAITSLFKRSVTGLFFPFHARNFVSGQIQNFEVLGKDALNPKNINAGRKIAYLMGKGEKIPAGVIELSGKTQKFSDVMKPFVDRFSGDTFYNADFDMALKSGGELKSVAGLFSKERLKTTLKTAGLGQEAIPFKVGRAVGQFIEHQQKATAYVTALGQGKTIPEALRLAEAAGFDYRALTKFESQIMRRIIPFYSFARKNVELQLKTLGETPERINQVLRFFGNIGDTPTEEEKAALPDFIKESIGVKLQDTPEGLKQYISTFGTPIEAFTQLFGSNPILRAISMTNPLIKAPVEIGIGKDSFRQRDLKDVYQANEYKLAPQIVKDLLEIKEVQKDVLKKNPQGKLIKVGTKIQYVADPIKLLIARSLFTSRGVSYLDQLFGNDLQGFAKFLKTTTGVKPQQIDIEAQKYFKERDKKRELEDLLIRTGEAKKFQKVYIPK